VIEGGFYRREQRSSIRDSRFDNVGTLALLGTVDAAVSGNVFANAKGPSLLLDGGSDTEIAGNFILGGKDAHGIKVTGGGKDIALSANLIVAAGLNGIFADAGASDLMIEANVIAGSGRSGVSVASADCIALSANLLLQNKHSGLAIRDSAGLSVTGNRFIDNGTAGISITHQPGYGRVLISSNELDGNRVGIKGSTTATLEFAANDFSAQAPRLLDGELVQFTGRFLDFSGSGAPTTIAGLDLKGQSTLTPSGALRPTSCSFPKDV